MNNAQALIKKSEIAVPVQAASDEGSIRIPRSSNFLGPVYIHQNRIYNSIKHIVFYSTGR